jgi:hypothetical protein
MVLDKQLGNLKAMIIVQLKHLVTIYLPKDRFFCKHKWKCMINLVVKPFIYIATQLLLMVSLLLNLLEALDD